VTVFGHVIVSGHVLGYMRGHMIRKLQKGHMLDHMIVSQGHVSFSQDHMGESSSSLSGYR